MEIANTANRNMTSTEVRKDVNGAISNTVQDQKVSVQRNRKEGSDISRGEKVTEKTYAKAVEEANKKLVSTNKEMRLSIHEKTKKINIKIIDKETDEVIKEYPPEKLLDIFAKMIELSGLIVDEKR